MCVRIYQNTAKMTWNEQVENGSSASLCHNSPTTSIEKYNADSNLENQAIQLTLKWEWAKQSLLSDIILCH